MEEYFGYFKYRESFSSRCLQPVNAGGVLPLRQSAGGSKYCQSGGIRSVKRSVPLVLCLVASGCSSMSGQVDFVSPPEHEWQIGSWTLLVYPSQTVLHTGGTYYFLDLSFYILVGGLVGLLVLTAVARLTYRRRRRTALKAESVVTK